MLKKTTTELRPIKVKDIEPNKENPRGARTKYRDDNFEYLKRSITQVGLLVPIVVKEQKNKTKKYLLIDGERRYWASLGIGLEEINANILPEDTTKGEIQEYMFHIHNNRTPWGPAQECRALESYYEKIKLRYSKRPDDLIAALVKYTGDAKPTVEERILFLNWPKDVREKVYNKDGYEQFYWIVVAIEKHVIIPAQDKIPEYFQKVKVDEVRKSLLKKYIKKTVEKGTETRKIKDVLNFSNTEEKRESKKIFNKLVKDVNYTFEEAREEFTTMYPKIDIIKLVNNIVKDVKKIESALKILGRLEIDKTCIHKLTEAKKSIETVLNK